MNKLGLGCTDDGGGGGVAGGRAVPWRKETALLGLPGFPLIESAMFQAGSMTV